MKRLLLVLALVMTPTFVHAQESIPPDISIAAPQDGEQVPATNRYQMSAAATDESGIQYLALFIDGKKVAERTESECRLGLVCIVSYKWNTHPYKDQIVTVSVLAVDIWNNSKTVAINVSVTK